MNDRPVTPVKPKPIRKALPTWITFWLLFVAPGQVMRFAIPYSPAETARRLKLEGALIKPMQRGYAIVLHLPEARTERKFNGWIEPDGLTGSRSWLTGQTRTSIRSALSRLAISVALCLLALFFLSSERLLWGVLFLVGCLGYVLLAQYERITGRDRRLYAIWLRTILDAQAIATWR